MEVLINATSIADSHLPPLPTYTLSPLPPLLPWISDGNLSPLLLFLAYWIVSLIFHTFDIFDLFPQYRLHTPAEILKRNHASRTDVLRDVLLQQFIQTLVALVLAAFDPIPVTGKEEYDVAVWAQRLRIAQGWIPGVLATLTGLDAKALAGRVTLNWPVLGAVLAGGKYPELVQEIVYPDGIRVLAPAFAEWEVWAAKAVYHVGIPVVQFSVAVVILDTWQYFWHRAMHMNQWLYTTIHSRHHRLYVPYAYGALYNHPIEALILDSLGAAIAFLATGMTVRQGMWFFTGCTIKTVDDHCGYALPWDPLQHLTANNATYHDIHHQPWGIKSNFSQPFFTVWDRWLGTIWRGGDVKLRYERSRKAAEIWWEEQRRKALGEKDDMKPAPEPSGSEGENVVDEEDVAAVQMAKKPRKKLSVGQAGSLQGLKERVNCGSGVSRMQSRR